MKKLILIVILLIASLALANQVFADVIPYGSAVVDGNLDEWADATWNSFDNVYDSNPVDIVDGAWAARWTPDWVYVAVKIQDSSHILLDEYTDWYSKDATEMYIHTTGSGGGYSDLQEPAQEWVTGMKSAADGSTWSTLGYPPAYPAPYTNIDYQATVNEYVTAGSISGQWYYYEAKIKPMEYFAGLYNRTVTMPMMKKQNIVTTLAAGAILGMDVTALSNDGVSTSYGLSGYAGMKNHLFTDQGSAYVIGGWSAYYERIAQHTLGPVAYTATAKVTLGDFGGDPDGLPITIKVSQNNVEIRTVETTLNADAQFSINNVEPGDYVVNIKPSHWLGYTVPFTLTMPAENKDFGVIPDSSGTNPYVFINGDIDGDNTVSLFDLDAITTGMDLEAGDPGFNAAADLDGDEVISLFDLDITTTNMDLEGE